MGLWPFVLPVNEGGAKCGPGAAAGLYRVWYLEEATTETRR
jgi:hypothetical protein